MNWFGFGVDMGFSVVFALLSGGVIPIEHYRKFRKLAVKILERLPNEDVIEIINEANAKRIAPEVQPVPPDVIGGGTGPFPPSVFEAANSSGGEN